MNAHFNINSDALVVLTNKLEKMHRSAFPSAVRGTLNKAAFDVKKNTLPSTVDSEFVKRQPNFFKRFSAVEMAKGFDVHTMSATIGMVRDGLQGGTGNKAVDDLEQQEHGGTIGGRSFIPLNTARVGNDHDKNVRAINRLAKVKNVFSAHKNNAKTAKGRFLRTAFAANTGGYVLSEAKRGRQILWRIDSISSSMQHRRLIIKKTALYSFEKGRDVKVGETKFMETASLESGSNLEKFYGEEAKRQFERLMG